MQYIILFNLNSFMKKYLLVSYSYCKKIIKLKNKRKPYTAVLLNLHFLLN